MYPAKMGYLNLRLYLFRSAKSLLIGGESPANAASPHFAALHCGLFAMSGLGYLGLPK